MKSARALNRCSRRNDDSFVVRNISDQKIAFGKSQNAAAARADKSERALDRNRAVGFAVADRAEIPDVIKAESFFVRRWNPIINLSAGKIVAFKTYPIFFVFARKTPFGSRRIGANLSGRPGRRSNRFSVARFEIQRR